MSRRSEQRNNRYAEDPEYRERILASNRAYNKKNAKKLSARRRERRATDPEFRERENACRRATARESRLKYDYGLSLEEYAAMVAEQDGTCPICEEKAELCVDHCHVYDMVRLLLCRNCNLGLGYFKDNPMLLSKGSRYVELFQQAAEVLKKAGALPKEQPPGRKKGRARLPQA
jgi:hypothetical protein